MDLLARREHSSHELLEKLCLRFPEQIDLCRQVLETLREEGLQSDQRFAESYIRLRVSRGHGPIKIAAELRQKGVAPELLSSSLAASGYDWFELAAEAAAKRFGDQPARDLLEKARRVRFLAQRGFNQEQIREVVG